MKGDFTRDTFNPAKHFLRVLMQQGRVQLDADFNEQTAILLHYMQTLAADLIGPHGGPEANLGFGIVTDVRSVTHLTKIEKPALKDEQTSGTVEQLLSGREKDAIDFVITKGRYYVDGVLCENEDYVLYSEQGNYQRHSLPPAGLNLLLYLDVWERPINYIEDEQIREVALGGADTAERTRVEWQIKIWPPQEENRGDRKIDEDDIKKHWPDWVSFFQPANHGRLRARVKPAEGAIASEPCIIHPDARYRGAENQLYRVEIHRSGAAGQATFKWSRENGSVMFPILRLNGSKARLAHLGRDSHLGLRVNDWVEIVDDAVTVNDIALNSKADNLFQVAEIDPIDSLVTLKVPEGIKLKTYDETSTTHPYLRRWDQRGDAKFNGEIIVKQAESDKEWFVLEDNLQVQFLGDKDTLYRRGDYWLIPARTATGDIEWPKDPKTKDDKVLPAALPPHGIEHHYAPLAIWETADKITDCRWFFSSLASRK